MSINISEIVSRYPKLEPWKTEDGSTALRLDLESSGYYLLLTNDDDSIPQDADTRVWFSIYDAHGEQIEDTQGFESGLASQGDRIDVSQGDRIDVSLSDRIERTLSADKSFPGSVRQYFVSRLGQSSNLVFDMALCPLDCTVGDDCKKVIDSTADLFDSLHAAWGKRSEEEDQIRCIVADICNVFWTG